MGEAFMIDRIILGHNQFFGVNHLIAQTGNEREAYFSDVSRILDIIDFSMEQGVKAMMMSTHERAAVLSEEILRRPTLRDELGIYLLVPYAAKYIKQANEKGLVNVVMDALGGTSLQDKLSMVFRGGMGVISKDAKRLMTALVDFEVAPFSKLNLRAIFLHDVVTDLLLGWNLPEVFELYSRHVRKKYGAIPAFCTKNLPRLMDLIDKTDIENPLIMASINKLGYQVNPSREAFEECLRTRRVRLLAMSTLAAGYLRPQEAYEYLFSLPSVESVVVGVSTKEHAIETFAEIRKHMKDTEPALEEMEMAI
jgi:predicted aldo/keto reductase-like oxidoreductase